MLSLNKISNFIFLNCLLFSVILNLHGNNVVLGRLSLRSRARTRSRSFSRSRSLLGQTTILKRLGKSTSLSGEFLSKKNYKNSCDISDMLMKLYCDPNNGIINNCHTCNGEIYYVKKLSSMEQHCCLLGIYRDGKCYKNSFKDKNGNICRRDYYILKDNICTFDSTLFENKNKNLLSFITILLVYIPICLIYSLFCR